MPSGPRLAPNQVRGFWAAWGGWTLDGLDSFIYALVLVPALRDLLPASGILANTASVGFYGGLLFALFLVPLASSPSLGGAPQSWSASSTTPCARNTQFRLRCAG